MPCMWLSHGADPGGYSAGTGMGARAGAAAGAGGEAITGSGGPGVASVAAMIELGLEQMGSDTDPTVAAAGVAAFGGHSTCLGFVPC